MNVVIAASQNAYGIFRARRMGVPVEVAPAELLEKEMKPDLEKWIWEILLKYNVKNVFLAGYMKIVSQGLIEKMQSCGIVLNVHPSLLPKYKGLNAFESAVADGGETGVTVHHVVPEVDSGEHLVQRQFHSTSKLHLHINEQFAVRSALRRHKGAP